MNEEYRNGIKLLKKDFYISSLHYINIQRTNESDVYMLIDETSGDRYYQKFLFRTIDDTRQRRPISGIDDKSWYFESDDLLEVLLHKFDKVKKHPHYKSMLSYILFKDGEEIGRFSTYIQIMDASGLSVGTVTKLLKDENLSVKGYSIKRI